LELQPEPPAAGSIVLADALQGSKFTHGAQVAARKLPPFIPQSSEVSREPASHAEPATNAAIRASAETQEALGGLALFPSNEEVRASQTRRFYLE
jgi:hypothetical protein